MRSQAKDEAMTESERLECAADWLQRLQVAPDDESVRSEWLRWCRESPENQHAFEKMQQLWQAFDQPDARHSLVEQESRRPRIRVPRALAASLLLAIGGIGAMLFWRAQEQSDGTVRTLTTAVAEHGSQILADGSEIDLGAHTRIVTRYTKERRSIALEAGEAYFKVTKDPHRPFVVNAGAVKVTAVGTAFSVRRATDRTVVTVTEGVVRVAPDSGVNPGHEVRAGVGEQVTFTESSSSLVIGRTDPNVATAWRTGVLKFMDEPLADVISSVNRYSVRRIEITDPYLASQVFTGTVYEDRIGDWLQALERVFPVEVVDEGTSTIRIEPRR